MDQSELEDRTFNEREVLYDIRIRNKEVLEKVDPKEKETEKEEENKKQNSEADGLTQAELLDFFLKYQAEHPGITLKEFIAMVESGEITVGKEKK